MLKAIIEKDAAKIRKQITALKWQLTQDIPDKDREIFTQTVTELEAALAGMEREEIYDTYQERIPQITEVDRVEETARQIYDRVAAYNRELADSMDMVIGTLARAYEAQGFNGGLMVARGAL